MAYFKDYLAAAQAAAAFGGIDKYLALSKALNPNFDVEAARTEYNNLVQQHDEHINSLYDGTYTKKLEEEKAAAEAQAAEEAKAAEEKKAALAETDYDSDWVSGLSKGSYNEYGQYVPSRYTHGTAVANGTWNTDGWSEDAINAIREKYGDSAANYVKSKMESKTGLEGNTYYVGNLDDILQDYFTLSPEEQLDQTATNTTEDSTLEQELKNLLGANYAKEDKSDFYNLVAKSYNQGVADKLKEAIDNGTVRDNGLGISWSAYLKDLLEGENRERAVQNDATRENKGTYGESWAEATGDTESYGEDYKESTGTQGAAGETYVQQNDNSSPTRGAFWRSEGDYSGATNAAAGQAAMAEEAQSAQAQAKQNYLSNASAGINRSRAGMLSDADADSTSGVANTYAANKSLGASTQADYLKKMAEANAAQQQAENLRRGSGYNTLGAVLQGAGSGAAMGATISDENMKESPKEFDQNKLIEAVKEFKRLKKRLDELKARRTK